MQITLKEKSEAFQDALYNWKHNGLKNLTISEMERFNARAEEVEHELYES